MFKTIAIIVAIIAVIAYSTDKSALESWTKTAGNVAVGITHAVKDSGHFMHQALRQDSTISDKVSNAAEDISYAIGEHITASKVAKAVINSQLPVDVL
jgi:hypothetical protein